MKLQATVTSDTGDEVILKSQRHFHISIYNKKKWVCEIVVIFPKKKEKPEIVIDGKLWVEI